MSPGDLVDASADAEQRRLLGVAGVPDVVAGRRLPGHCEPEDGEDA
jgi:hypothetical protein